jgi:hypothetical protein
MPFRLDDYIDGDVAYLAGLIIGRGTIIADEDVRRLRIEFPYTSLQVQGTSSTFDQETSIRLGLDSIRERLLELLSADIRIVRRSGGVDLVVSFLRNNMIWRNILLLTNGETSYQSFHIPPVFFDPDISSEWKRQFVRGYADVAGNIRHSNRDQNNRHRVRLDVLNYPTNWGLPVELCLLLQEQIGVPVQLITWGHPNLGRAFREHQLNIFAQPFLAIGFSFDHKQKLLEEFAAQDEALPAGRAYAPCPGVRRVRRLKPADPDENNAAKLDPRLVGQHYDAYWQICKALGCPRYPAPGDQAEMEFSDELEAAPADGE